jgi:hypothetical protein
MDMTVNGRKHMKKTLKMHTMGITEEKVNDATLIRYSFGEGVEAY